MSDEISVQELQQKIQNGDHFTLIDVREESEVAVGKIEQSIHIAMSEFQQRVSELDKNEEYVIQCRSGKRSRNVLEFMRQCGYKNLYNLTGGITAWSNEIDPSIKVG